MKGIRYNQTVFLIRPSVAKKRMYRQQSKAKINLLKTSIELLNDLAALFASFVQNVIFGIHLPEQHFHPVSSAKTNNYRRRETMDRPTTTSTVPTSTPEPHGRRPNGRNVTEPASVGSDADLSPWTPTGDDTWDAAKAAHLLRRTGFGAPPALVDQIIPYGLVNGIEAVVDGLFESQSLPLPEPPGTWTTRTPFANPGVAEQQQYLLWARELQEWWLNRMHSPESPQVGLREKMTLFWHNHFTSQLTVVYVAQYFYQQNQLFRYYALGNFKELTRKITVDPCMLIYLDLGLSKTGNPNENYPRELLELFAIGEGTYSDGTPHYTEHDIVELSRALTGWTVEGLESRFRSTRFDSGNKTIFGETANFGLDTAGDRDVIDLIFDQVDHDHNRKRAAIFLCSKLYRWFVYDVPNMEIVEGMADTLTANDWNIEPVLRQLFASKHFFSKDVAGALIKSPADYVVGAMNEFNLDPSLSQTGINAARPETYDPVTAMSALAQTLLEPPNVKGWPGGRTWISSVTAPQRIRFVESWIAPISGARDYKFYADIFVGLMPESEDVHAVLDRMLTTLLPIPVSNSVRENLLVTLLGGGKDYEWDPNHPSTAQRIRSTLIEITRLAEYQLM